MLRELSLQQRYLEGHVIESIYFGGGTPSLLEAGEVDRLIGLAGQYYEIAPHAEITLEANPDDLTPAKVRELRGTPVNRFSIGVQSFFEEDLRWMNRAHNATEAESSIKRVQDAGFENITIDLIYGYPLLSDEKWEQNLRSASGLDIVHLSAYSMTVEPKTALASFIRKGKQAAMDEEQSARQFMVLMETMPAAGYEQYEISNFAKPGQHARHNSNYWKGVPYLGIGPSAHSFNGTQRQWNIANNPKYIAAISKGDLPFESESLTTENRVNEYIMTSLRTMWGMDLAHINQQFGSDYEQKIREGLQILVEKGEVDLSGSVATLTTRGKLLADHITSELFIAED